MWWLNSFKSWLCRQTQMLSLLSVALVGLFLAPCDCFFVEISFSNSNESKNLKLLCGHPAENLNPKTDHKVLWHGVQFGNDEQQKISELLSVPNISINSSNRHICYLLAEKDSPYNAISQKKRVLRDSLASIPLENGVCSPGYRIDQDRCFPCFPGSYTSGQDTECFLCPKDFYMDKKAADSCWPCPEGKRTLAQGADAEESCVYFDDAGHPVPPQNPPWTLIYSLIGFIIICVWIVIVVLLVRHFRGLKQDDAEKVERSDSRTQKPLLHESGQGEESYESTSDVSDKADHIYAEIVDDDDDDAYETPRKPSHSPIYVDLEAPPSKLPPKKPRRSSEVMDSDPYEIPIEETSEDQYEIPIGKTSEDQYEVPIKKSVDERSDHLYEVIDDEEQSETDEGEKERRLPKTTSSTGFEHGAPKSNVGKRHSRSAPEIRKPSSENRKSQETTSSEKMPSISEETENIYDIPESDSN